MMRRTVRSTIPTHPALLAAVVLLAASGCRSSAVGRRASLAEREGRHHEAYELYCEEARQSPSNRGVRSAIARVAPGAARHWQIEGDRAAARGHYDEAWGHYMRALEITPDNDALVSLVRNLETQHPDAVSSPKEAWLSDEGRTLASAQPREAPPEPEPAPPPPGAGTAERGLDAAEGNGRPAEASESEDKRPSREEVRRSEPASPPPPPVPAEERRAPAAPPPERDEPEFTARVLEGRYIFTTILSTGDKRFPRSSANFDGLRIKLLDTDDDPDADFEVSLDGTRIKKASNVPPGRGAIVRGRSGRWYEVVVLTVADSTESARIGVRPHSR